MKPLVFQAEAFEEYAAARLWYRERSVDAMTAFQSAVERELERIREAPDRWARCDAIHRLHIVDDFPYHIVYRDEPTQIRIVAVAHSQRRYRYWKRRS